MADNNANWNWGNQQYYDSKLDKVISNINDNIITHTDNDKIHLTAENVAEIHSNDNIVINPNFLINQRGLTTYANVGYTVDLWKIDGGTLTINEGGGVTFSNPDSSIVRLRQNIIYEYEQLAGKEITISTNINGEIYSGHGVVSFEKPTGNDIQIAYIDIGEGWSLNLNYSPSNNIFITYFTLNPTYTINVLWAKFEIGNIATTFHAPAPTIELAKCQRYYQKYQGKYTAVGVGYIASATRAMFVLPLTTMHTKPTATFYGTAYVTTVGFESTSAIPVTEFSSSPAYNTSTAVFNVAISEANSAIGNGVVLQFRDDDSYIEFDASP